MCVCARARTRVCVHAHACLCAAKTTRRGSRRNGPFYLFTQLSGGDLAVGVAFPLVLRLASSHLSCTRVYPFCLVSRSLPPSRKARGPSSSAGSFVEPGREGWKWESILAPYWPFISGCELDIWSCLCLKIVKIPEVLWLRVHLFDQGDPWPL